MVAKTYLMSEGLKVKGDEHEQPEKGPDGSPESEAWTLPSVASPTSSSGEEHQENGEEYEGERLQINPELVRYPSGSGLRATFGAHAHLGRHDHRGSGSKTRLSVTTSTCWTSVRTATTATSATTTTWTLRTWTPSPRPSSTCHATASSA